MQDQNLLNRHPGLANLVTDLNTRFLTPTGTSLHLDQELHQARYALKHKKSYLESKTLFEPIDRLRFLPLDNYNNLSSTDPNNVVGLNQAAAAADLQRDISTHLDRLLSILETRRLIIPSTDTPTQSIGRSSRSSDNNNGRSSIGGSGAETGSVALAPPPSIIEILASRNKTQSHDAHVDLDEFVDKALTLFETLNQSVVMLWEIVVQFKIRYQLEQDHTFREYFSQLVENLRLKLEILKVMVQEHVYNHDTVTKLAIIRYKTAGPEFNTIVQTYTDIMHRIDIVQDDIRRLQ
ncbi:hypothetical protein BGX24_008506 [Mortierella sp. AD032]|nr:hypothetical protein BGX24_008506 [Mortierella sp. AD032]